MSHKIFPMIVMSHLPLTNEDYTPFRLIFQDFFYKEKEGEILSPSKVLFWNHSYLL